MVALDSIEQLRVSNASSTLAMLTNPASIWTDNTASIIYTKLNPEGVTDANMQLAVHYDDWRGADAPDTGFAYAGAAGGDGQAQVGDQYSSRLITIPVIESQIDTSDPTNIDILAGSYSDRRPYS